MTDLLSPRDVAERVGFKHLSVLNGRLRRVLPWFHVGGRLRIRAADFEAWLRDRRLEAIDDQARELLEGKPELAERTRAHLEDDAA